jgi:FkbH-like protein
LAQLYWLNQETDWRAALKRLADDPWARGMKLANTNLDSIRTGQLDNALRQILGDAPPSGLTTRPIRLAILGSCTTAHLAAGIRVGALRRGIHVTLYEGEYGQYLQELADPESGLHRFAPNAILFAFDALHLTAGIHAGMDAASVRDMRDAMLERVTECWKLARALAQGQVIQQTPLPIIPRLMGSNEPRLPGSRAAVAADIAAALAARADAAGVDICAVDAAAARDGIAAWHDPAMWHRAKQEIAQRAAPVYGDVVGRLLAAAQGRSFKCLVLDLDNTLWGGVVGDDGLDGLVLGQGSALGEAHLAFQDYARELSRRGVILAVCSKNDEANAVEPFDRHPEMLLRRADIACFKANWSDKATNLRAIAQELNIGLDSLVFVDDNPFERNLIRQELPMVAVPELTDDPASYAATIADAGYFESVTISKEDLSRAAQYQANQARAAERGAATDLPAYLRGLEMRLIWKTFDRLGLSRIVQLINKTNQFNLTTKRYTEAEILDVMADDRAFGLQLRLLDRFGDNGIIAIVIGRLTGADCQIDTWLMSCRVLGRGVEAATLNLIAAQAAAMGAERLIGTYIPTAKNPMVADHYQKLGFDAAGILSLGSFTPIETFIESQEDNHAGA